jgi:hypothetical protein
LLQLGNFSEKGETINEAHYVQTPNKLRRAIREKRSKETVILQYDNTRPHTARLTLQTIQKNDCELLCHPPYSPNLAPSDYDLFGPRKITTPRLTRQSSRAKLERTSIAEA